MTTLASRAGSAELISFPRLGDALRAQRLHSGIGWLTISRADHVPFPDVLSDIERNECDPEPAQIDPLVAAYGMRSSLWSCGDDLQVIFDRTAGSDVEEGQDDVGVYAAVRRLVELVAICGMELSDSDLVVVSEALEISSGELSAYCDDAVDERADRAIAMEGLLDELVVPSIGLKVADTGSGTLLITRRRGCGGVRVDPCSSLGEVTTAVFGCRSRSAA